jgi:hypothetical protein
MIKITFLNGTVLETESFHINEDSVKLIKKLQPIKNTAPLQIQACKQGLKVLSDKRAPANFKLTEENRIRICNLWFNGFVSNINVFVEEYGLRYGCIRNVLRTRGVKYGYINRASLWTQERKKWWNTTDTANKKSLILNN